MLLMEAPQANAPSSARLSRIIRATAIPMRSSAVDSVKPINGSFQAPVHCSRFISQKMRAISGVSRKSSAKRRIFGVTAVSPGLCRRATYPAASAP